MVAVEIVTNIMERTKIVRHANISFQKTTHKLP